VVSASPLRYRIVKGPADDDYDHLPHYNWQFQLADS
jgi:hypothetical protein